MFGDASDASWANPDGGTFYYGSGIGGGGSGLGSFGSSAGLSSLGGGLASLFLAGNPASSANNYLNQISPMLQQYLGQYASNGQTASNSALNGFQQMFQNPQNIYNQVASNFQQQPGYQFNMQQGLAGINNAAAAGGMLGTPMNQQQSGTLASNLANQSFNQYMQNALGIMNTGAQGTQGVANTGASTANSLSESLGNVLGAQGQYAAQQTSGQNSGLSQLFSGAAAVLPFLGL